MTKDLNSMEYRTEDIILPDLELPNPCPIKIRVTENSVYLYVGPRDWQ